MLLLACMPAGLLCAQDLSGNWYTSDQQEEWLSLLPNGYFKVQWGMGNEYAPPETGWGMYEFDGRQLVMLYFNGTRQQYRISQNGPSSFVMQDAEGNQWHYRYEGEAALNENDQLRLLSEVNFYRLAGSWETEGEVLKFMGDGILIGVSPENGSQFYRYSTLGNTLRIKHIKEIDDNFFFVGELSDFTRESFVLTGEDGQPTVYRYLGKPQLSSWELQFYMMWLQTIHRTNMRIIDAMDGVQDFIWRRVDKNGNPIH